MLEMLRDSRTTTLIFLLVLVLLGLSLTMVYSSSAVWAAIGVNKQIAQKYEVHDQVFPSFHSPLFVRKQAVWILLGLIALFGFYSINYEAVTRHHWLILGLAVVGLLAVLATGARINGARRWIQLGPLTLQPSEFAKLALVIFMSKFLHDNKDRLDSFKRVFAPCAAVSGVFMLLLMLEPDFGATVVVFAICLSIWFIAGVPFRYLSGLFAMGIPVLIVLALTSPYRLRRLLAFFMPDADPTGSGWQLNQALITMGSGGLFGKGLGLGMQKNCFLAESYNDFIFAIVGEELGLMGTLLTLTLFCILIGLLFWVAYRAIDYQGALLAGGIATMIAIPAFVHMGVAAGMLPPKGLSLPFVSYGGSAMLVNLAAIGILMNVARAVDKQTAERARLRRMRRRRENSKTRPAPMWVRG
ncbi:putative lipid II flippase FtsW [Candidatus Sumerlaeota bacterium]